MPPSAPRSLTAPSSSRSRDSVAWVVSMPSASSSASSSLWLRTCWRETSSTIRACRVGARAAPRSGRGVAGAGRRVLIGALQQPGQQRLLGVQPVLRLVPDRAARAVEHRVGDLVAAVRGQAVQGDRAGRGAVEQRVVDLQGAERRRPVAAVGLLPHRDPGVGDDDLGAVDRGVRVGDQRRRCRRSPRRGPWRRAGRPAAGVNPSGAQTRTCRPAVTPPSSSECAMLFAPSPR